LPPVKRPCWSRRDSLAGFLSSDIYSSSDRLPKTNTWSVIYVPGNRYFGIEVCIYEMSDIIAAALPNIDKGRQAMKEVVAMSRKREIRLLDACLVWRREDGSLELWQFVENLEGAIRYGLLIGGLTGFALGLIFIGPIALFGIGLLLGGVFGAIFGYLSDYGINNDFIREAGTLLEPEASAVFLLADSNSTQKILDHLSAYTGEILHSSYSRNKEKDLFRQLQKARKENRFREILDINDISAARAKNRGKV